MPVRIAVITGSTRKNRFSEKPALWIAEQARKLPDVEVETLDLRDYVMPFFEEAIPPSMAGPAGYDVPVVKKWSEKIAAADAFIIVTPEYNHGYPAVLKNALDYAFFPWQDKPVGFVSWGSVGGARAVEQLRQVAVELHMASVRDSVHIPGDVVFPIIMGKAEWKPDDHPSLKKNADAMLGQLVFWAKGFRDMRANRA